MATTLRQIRRDVLLELGDLRILTATDAGTDDTFIDTVNLTGGVNAYAGRDVLFTGGTSANLGQQRYVIASSRQQRALGFDIPLPAATAEGDEVELINTKQIGFKFQDIANFVNVCLRSLGRDGMIPATTDEATFAYGTGLSVPAEFRTVEYVYRQDTYDTANWHELPKATRNQGSGWWVDVPQRQVFITGRTGSCHDGATVRVTGLQEPPLMVDDNDSTDVDYVWLLAAVQAKAARARWLRQKDRESERLVYILNQQADALRARVVTRRSPWSVNL